MLEGNYRDENASERKKKYIEEYRFRYGVDSIKMQQYTFKHQIDKKSDQIASRKSSRSHIMQIFSSPKNQIQADRRLTTNDVQMMSSSRNASRKNLFSEATSTIMSATISPRSNN